MTEKLTLLVDYNYKNQINTMIIIFHYLNLEIIYVIYFTFEFVQQRCVDLFNNIANN